MVFSSIFFIFIFLPFTLMSYYIAPRKIRNIFLLIMSLLFYAWGEPAYILLMVATTLFNYFIARYMDKNKSNSKSKYIFIFAVVVNLYILGFFKYYGFLLDNINSVFNMNIQYRELPLPIGISFYTFQTLSYLIDVYLGKVKVQKNVINFSLYVTMFPQLVAGPIVRYADVNKELSNRKESINTFGEGIERFIQGLGKKILLANNIGIVWTNIQTLSLGEISVVTAWIGIIAYTLQIYFDFSAYSDMAIGLGKMFGFSFIENFNYPYVSKSITEFWRRWHISLGSWFREYVYIPLGGNRKGIYKQCRNLFVVWLLTGLWHGASWNFIVWGLYYGCILFIEKLFLKSILDKIPNVFCHMYTMFLVIVGWVFFGIDSISDGVEYIKIMIGLSNNNIIDSKALYYISNNKVLFILLFIFATPIMNKVFNKIKRSKGNSGIIISVIALMLLFMLCIAYLVNESYNPFLYFRF